MEFSWIDLVGGGLIAVFLVLGFVRGLWWQVIRAVGLIAAVLVARAASPRIAPWIADTWPDLSPRLANGIAWFGVFLLALVAATLFGLLGRKVLEAMQLGLADRFGGAAVGALTGLLLHVALLVILCQLATEGYLSRTLEGTTSERIVDVVGARWPVVLGKEAGAEVDGMLKRLRLDAASGRPPAEPAPDAAKPGTVR
jgi:membrane protein required for colicin V production